MARPRLADKRKNLPPNRRLYTRTEIAKQLGVSRTTLLAYEKVAIFHVSDYRDIIWEFPRLKRRQPLTHYQAWVLGKIYMMYSAFPNGTEAYSQVSRFLKENSLIASFESYCQELSKSTLQSGESA